VQPDTPLTTALSMLLEAGISALPVVNGSGSLLDVYARGDITLLARCNAYSRLQFEDMTVGQALSLAGCAATHAAALRPASGSGALPLLSCGACCMTRLL
jgi:CBS domain